MFQKRTLKFEGGGNDFEQSRPVPLGFSGRITVWLLAGLVPLLYYFWLNEPEVAEENGPLEWLQVVILIGAVEAHAIHALRQPRRSVLFVLSASLSALAFAFALREIDVLEFGKSGFYLALETTLQYVKYAIGIGLVIFLASQLRLILASFSSLLRQPIFWLSVVAGVLLISSSPFDDNVLALQGNLSRLIEELLELVAFSLLFIAGMSAANNAQTSHRIRLHTG